MTVEATAQVARITVELPQSDYRVLKVAAAASGGGVSMSSVIRDLVHQYVESLQDEADIAMILDRLADPRPRLSMDQMRQHLAQRRSASDV
jgi:Arc/MetJ-type ribon-helix-helix transcriptional regulator